MTNTPLFVVGLLVAGLGLSGILGIVPSLSGSIAAIPALPSVDTASATSCASCATQSVSMTTTTADMIIVIVGYGNGFGIPPTVSTPTNAGGLTFTQRYGICATSNGCASAPAFAEYYALSSTALTSQPISVTLSAPTQWTLIAFAVQGATGFDPATTPKWQSNGNTGLNQYAGITTSGSNDFVFMYDVTPGNPTFTPNAPLTTLISVSATTLMSSFVGATTTTAPLTSTTLSLVTSVGEPGNAFADALIFPTATSSTTTTSTTSTTTTTTTTTSTTTTSALIVQPMVFSLQGSGTTASAVTISGCNASPTSLLANGQVNYVTMNPGCQFSASLPTGYFFAGGCNCLSTIILTSGTSSTAALITQSYIVPTSTTTTTSSSSTTTSTTSTTTTTTIGKGIPLIGFTLFGAGLVTMIGAARLKGKHDSG